MDNFEKLIKIVEKLRGPDGCEWDKALTLDQIKPYLLEECYEVFDSILNNDHAELKEELGDMLFHVVLISQMEKEAKEFTIDEVLEIINDKMIRRHPHVFGNIKTKDVNVIVENWEKIKEKEKKHRKSLLDGIPRTMPSLLRAYKIQSKVAQIGFDWNDEGGVIKKIKEETEELEFAINQLKNNEKNSSLSKVEEEIGDLIFSAVNLARKMNLDPESSLTRTNDKFKKRFLYIENKLKEMGKNLRSSTPDEMDKLWEESKNFEKK